MEEGNASSVCLAAGGACGGRDIACLDLLFLRASNPIDRNQTRLTKISSFSSSRSCSSSKEILAKHPAPLVLPLPIFLGFPSLFKVTPITNSRIQAFKRRLWAKSTPHFRFAIGVSPDVEIDPPADDRKASEGRSPGDWRTGFQGF